MSPWDRIDAILSRLEGFLLVILVGVLIATAFLQIVLRNVFATGLSWGDPLVRNMVLWIGSVGGAMATREIKHINIDLVSRWSSPSGRTVIQALTHLFSASVCALLSYAGLKFIKNEIGMRNVTFLGIPSWIPALILPFAFGVMAFRFGLLSFKNLSIAAGKGNRIDRGGR